MSLQEGVRNHVIKSLRQRIRDSKIEINSANEKLELHKKTIQECQKLLEELEQGRSE